MRIITEYYVFRVEAKQHVMKICYRKNRTWDTFEVIHRFIDGKDAGISDLFSSEARGNFIKIDKQQYEDLLFVIELSK
jgi:hypothetical protein